MQYYYSLKILHGQDPSCIWVGWVTSAFRPPEQSFDLERVCTVMVTLGDEWGKVLQRSVTIVYTSQEEEQVVCTPV